MAITDALYILHLDQWEPQLPIHSPFISHKFYTAGLFILTSLSVTNGAGD